MAELTLRVLHHLTGGDIDRCKLEYLPPNGTLDQCTLTPAFRPPPAQFGQGYYTVNMTLEDANVKLSSVISDVLGQSGRAILDAIVAGEDEPKALAA